MNEGRVAALVKLLHLSFWFSYFFLVLFYFYLWVYFFRIICLLRLPFMVVPIADIGDVHIISVF
jgi:hypothetical protein